MSNIYLKVTIEKNCRTQNFYFLSLKGSSPGQFLGSSNWFFKLHVTTREVWSKTVCSFFIILIQKGVFFKVESILFVEKNNINVNKYEPESKLKNYI